MNRFTRQIRLDDVGEAGQAKLGAARVELRTSGFARTIEATYLHAAGLGSTDGAEPADNAVSMSGADLGLRHGAAREVAEGAYAALVAMRAVLLGDMR